MLRAYMQTYIWNGLLRSPAGTENPPKYCYFEQNLKFWGLLCSPAFTDHQQIFTQESAVGFILYAIPNFTAWDRIIFYCTKKAEHGHRCKTTNLPLSNDIKIVSIASSNDIWAKLLAQATSVVARRPSRIYANKNKKPSYR